MSAPTTEIPQVKPMTPQELLARHLLAFGGKSINDVEGKLISPTGLDELTKLNSCACCHADDHPRSNEPDDKFLRGQAEDPIIPQPFSLN